MDYFRLVTVALKMSETEEFGPVFSVQWAT